MLGEEQRLWLVTVLLGSLIIFSAIVILGVREAPVAVVGPLAWVGVETVSAFPRLFGALILLLYPTERASRRFHWLAVRPPCA